MKTFRAKSGGFIERPYYKLSEIENACVDALSAVQELPTTPSPIRIDRFIEKHFRVYVEFVDLGDGILGCTEFGPSGVTAIIVSRELEERGDQVSQRRVRSTLGHEVGHGLFHTHLVLSEAQDTHLFTDRSNPDQPRILCRDIPGASNATGSHAYRWWEWQANRAMSCLLLPHKLLQVAMTPFMVSRGLLGEKVFDRSKFPVAVARISEVFDVNPIVARLRIDDLYPEQQDAQGWL